MRPPTTYRVELHGRGRSPSSLYPADQGCHLVLLSCVGGAHGPLCPREPLRRQNLWYMMWKPTYSPFGSRKPSGTVHRISKPSDSHRATARVLDSTTELNCMAR